MTFSLTVHTHMERTPWKIFFTLPHKWFSPFMSGIISRCMNMVPSVCVPGNLWMWPWHPAPAFAATYCPCDHSTSGSCSSSTAGVPSWQQWSRSLALLSNHSFSRDRRVNGGRSHLNERQGPGMVYRAHFCNSFSVSQDLNIGNESTRAFSLSYYCHTLILLVFFFLLIICPPIFSFHFLSSRLYGHSAAWHNKKHWFWMNEVFWRLEETRSQQRSILLTIRHASPQSASICSCIMT